MDATSQKGPIEIVADHGLSAITFTKDGSDIVTGSYTGEICRWRIDDGTWQLGSTLKASRRKVFGVVVSKDGRWIVTGDLGPKVIVWDAITHSLMLEITEHSDNVNAVDVSDDSTRIASASADHTVRIYSITSGARLLPPLQQRFSVQGVKFSPDGSRIGTVTHRRASLCIYDTHSGENLFQIPISVQAFPLTPLAWSSDSERLFVVSPGKITCINPSTSSHSEWSIHNTHPRASVVTTGRFIACSAGSSVSFWDPISHKQIGTVILEHAGEIHGIALSPNSRHLACTNDNRITIHNLTDVLSPGYFCDSPLLMEVSDAALKSWVEGDPTNAETILSDELSRSSYSGHYILANRALVRARLKDWEPAIEDAKESLRIQASPIGHVAMAVTLLSKGDQDGALRTFDLAFHDCNPGDNIFLLLLKSILAFESGRQEDAMLRVEYLVGRANNDATYLYTQVLGYMYMERGDYRRAIPLFERARKIAPADKKYPPLTTILLIFGWNFNQLDVIVRRRLLEADYATGRTKEAAEIRPNNATADKVTVTTGSSDDLVAMFEHLGDEAFSFAKHDDAIAQYSAALYLNPPSPTCLLIKRSRVRATKRLWDDALDDANEVIQVDPSCLGGYETKRVALHGAGRYNEAIATLNTMLSMIEQSPNPGIRLLCKDYVSPSKTIAEIDLIAQGIFSICPLVLIDVTTGRLCDGPERMRIFKDDSVFKEIVSFVTRKEDKNRIPQDVARYFGYVMFSHVWEGDEPSFQDVNLVQSVWDLDETPLNEKLRNFCTETCNLGYRWAWSDTCCIDKATSSILNQSLTSMYKWYEESAATLVLLASVTHPSKFGDLTRSLWMKRAWTLEELLAPKVIRFYDQQWKPYLGDTRANHKESPEIMQELADAIQIPTGTIVEFSPHDLEVRAKLRLASTRSATREEDVAYSLIGIFQSDIRPHYGERGAALGHLLQEIVARSGEVTVLAWTGKSSTFNSCLPASLAVYSQPPFTSPSIPQDEMDTCVSKLRSALPQDQALLIHDRVTRLPPARFANRRLHLPCIIFRVTVRRSPGDVSGHVYRARASTIGELEFQTADPLLAEKRTLVLVHSWIRDLIDPLKEFTDNGSEDDGWSTEYSSDSAESPFSLDVTSPAPSNEITHAYELIARLERPFGALLLQRISHQEYRRVAADAELVVHGFRCHLTSSKDVRVEVLEVL